MDKLLNHHHHLVIVDIGASGGIDPRWSKTTEFYKGILFEPDPREFDALKKNSDNNLIVINCALSDSKKEIEFHLCKKQMVSSVYPPNFNFLNKFADSERFNVEKIIHLNADTLDNQLKKEGIDEVDFIKIDTQGYELSILKGSSNCIENIVGLEVEVEFEPLYVGQPLFSEVDNYVKENGFILADLKRYYWKRKNNKNTGNRKGQIIFGDALYFKSPEQILSSSNISQEKIIRTIYVYLSYGYIDLSQVLLNISKNELEERVYILLLSLLKKYEKEKVISSNRVTRRLGFIFYKLFMLLDQGNDYSGTDRDLGNL
jgi:FkbM family methyltransferase